MELLQLFEWKICFFLYVMFQCEWPCYIECVSLSKIRRMTAYIFNTTKPLIKLKYAARPIYSV